MYNTLSHYLNIISIILTLYVLYKTFMIKEKNSLHFSFIATIICVLIWTLSPYLFFFYPNTDITGYIISPISLIAPCFYLTGYFFSHSEKKFKFFHLIYFIIPILSVIISFTNKSHHLMTTNLSFYLNENTYGPYFIVHALYTYSILGVGLMWFVRYTINNFGLFSRQAQLICLGSIIPIINATLMTFKIIPSNMFQNSLGFSFAIILYGMCITYYDFLNVVPIAFEKIADYISDGFIVLSKNYLLIHSNKTFIDLFSELNISPKSINFLDYCETFGLAKEQTKEDIHLAVSNNIPVVSEKHIHFPNFDKYFIIEITPIYSKHKHLATVLLFKNITTLKKNIIELELTNKELDQANQEIQSHYTKIEELNRRLKGMADTDGLTGIYNRRFFEEYYTIEASRITNQNKHLNQTDSCKNFSVAIIDIDNFKRVNDTYGHLIGDTVLKQTVNIINSIIFTRDVLCRYGGEEFVVMFTNTDKLGAIRASEKIRQKIEENLFDFGNGTYGHITISIGLAIFNESYTEGEDIKNVLRVADKRLYAAKHSGKNQVVFE